MPVVGGKGDGGGECLLNLTMIDGDGGGGCHYYQAESRNNAHNYI